MESLSQSEDVESQPRGSKRYLGRMNKHADIWMRRQTDTPLSTGFCPLSAIGAAAIKENEKGKKFHFF